MISPKCETTQHEDEGEVPPRHYNTDNKEIPPQSKWKNDGVKRTKRKGYRKIS